MFMFIHEGVRADGKKLLANQKIRLDEAVTNTFTTILQDFERCCAKAVPDTLEAQELRKTLSALIQPAQDALESIITEDLEKCKKDCRI